MFRVGDRVDHIHGLFKDCEIVFSDKDIWYQVRIGGSDMIYHHSWLTESKELKVLNILRQYEANTKRGKGF